MQLLDSPPLFFDKVSSADAEYDDAALEGMLREAHQVHVYHSQRGSVSVGLSSSSVSDRTGRPVGMNDSKDFQDVESIHSGNSNVICRPVSFPPHSISEGMLSHPFGVPSRREGPPSIWDTHGISGNVFANPDASSSAPHPQELNPW